MKGLATSRIAVVDDNEEEALPLIRVLGSLGMGSLYFTGNVDYLPEKPLNTLRLVFLDLRLMPSTTSGSSHSVRQAIGVLKRIIAPTHRGTGIVCWAKIQSDVEELRNRLAEAWPEFAPAFIKAIPDKNGFLGDNADMVKQRLTQSLAEQLKELHAHQLLWEWEGNVHHASATATNLLLDVSQSSSEKELLRLLASICRASAGVTNLDERTALVHLYEGLNPIAFDNLEHNTADVSVAGQYVQELKKEIDRKGASVGAHEKARLNRFLVISEIHEDDTAVRPGNVYICRPDDGKKCPLRRCEVDCDEIVGDLQPKLMKDSTYSELTKRIGKLQKRKVDSTQAEESLDSRRSEIIGACMPVLVEVTPECDYAQRKQQVARFVGGVLVPDEHAKLFNSKYPYIYPFAPLFIPELDAVWTLILDARFVYSVRSPKRLVKSRPVMRLRRLPLVSVQAWAAAQASRPGYVYIGR